MNRVRVVVAEVLPVVDRCVHVPAANDRLDNPWRAAPGRGGRYVAHAFAGLGQPDEHDGMTVKGGA